MKKTALCILIFLCCLSFQVHAQNTDSDSLFKAAQTQAETEKLEILNMLDTPNCNLTIEVIAIDSGFGSRNTFYRLFRERFGLTPVEFRNCVCEKRKD